jgi:hypothetical protein
MDRCRICCLRCGKLFSAELQFETEAWFFNYYDCREVDCPLCKQTTFVSESNMTFMSEGRSAGKGA